MRLNGFDQCSLNRSILRVLRCSQSENEIVREVCAENTMCCGFYLALPERCLDHIVPKLINQDVRQLGVVDELVDDLRSLWLLRVFQAFLDHVAAALLH